MKLGFVRTRVQVNQRNRFLPNVCRFLLPARLQSVEPPGGGAGSGIRRRSAENSYVYLPLPLDQSPMRMKGMKCKGLDVSFEAAD